MKKKLHISFVVFSFLLLLPLNVVSAQSTFPAVVRAVLFFSPTCPHCEMVITETLPPLKETYGDQLEIFLVDISTPEGQTLYQAAITYYEIPEGRLGVPTLVVGDTVLVGSIEIPEQFPGIIESGLAQGGLTWASIPGLETMLPVENTIGVERLTMTERFALDPKGNTVSVIVLLGMLLVVGNVAFTFKRPLARKRDLSSWLVPTLAMIGIIAALYLAYVEITQTDAICGPVGDCNTVQQSPYATLFRFLPVGVLGVIGYLLIFTTWGIQHYGRAEWRPPASKALWLMAGFGTLFSIYLTFLEPFVIGATCMWCITSAVVQTAIFWLATEPAKIYFTPSSKSKHTKHKRRKKRIPKKRARH